MTHAPTRPTQHRPDGSRVDRSNRAVVRKGGLEEVDIDNTLSVVLGDLDLDLDVNFYSYHRDGTLEGKLALIARCPWHTPQGRRRDDDDDEEEEDETVPAVPMCGCPNTPSQKFREGQGVVVGDLARIR